VVQVLRMKVASPLRLLLGERVEACELSELECELLLLRAAAPSAASNAQAATAIVSHRADAVMAYASSSALAASARSMAAMAASA